MNTLLLLFQDYANQYRAAANADAVTANNKIW